MAEDQSANGDIWNQEAATLLSYLSWQKIGDHNIDVKGDDDKKYGLDTILTFSDHSKNLPQSIILEAKRYKTTSFQSSMIKGWIERLDTKLTKLRNSDNFFEQFPELRETATLNYGIIAIWFSDNQNYKPLTSIFEGVKLSSKPKKSNQHNKIFVIDNPIILRLCSMLNAIKDIDNNSEFNYYYPSSLINEGPVVRSKTLSIEYIFSEIILAESKDKNDKECKIVFYFGELDVKSFRYIKSLLTNVQFMDKDKPLTLYLYQRNDEFRKIRPDVERMFSEIKFEIKNMDSLSDLPGSIKDLTI